MAGIWPTATPLRTQTNGAPMQTTEENESLSKKRKSVQEMQSMSSDGQIKEMTEAIAALQEQMDSVSFSCGETTNHTTVERSLTVLDKRMFNIEGAVLD